MSIVCACCGCTVAVERDVPGVCALCGRRAWRPGPPAPGRYDVSPSDERYLKEIGIVWASRKDG